MNINKLMADFEESNKKLLYDDCGGLTELGKFALMGLAFSLSLSIVRRLYPEINEKSCSSENDT